MRTLILSLLFLYSFRAEAEANYWLWYPRTPPGAPYGHQVVMDKSGHWMSYDGKYRWANYGTRNSNVLSPENSNRRNGELAYKAAYSSFQEGQGYKKNKVEPLQGRGRWVKKITTWQEIILYKDAVGNVAVQSPDGKWHVTNARGDYAYTKLELPVDTDDLSPQEMLAETREKKSGRSLASVSEPAQKKKRKAGPVFDNPLLPK